MQENSFELATPPEAAMGHDEYSNLASSELRALLGSGVCEEHTYHALLEDHPILVPGVFPSVKSGHNGIFPGGVISQPPLSGLDARVPDFCVISWDSGTLHITLTEIESPCKLWWTAKGQQRSEVTQAIGQLREWKAWFDNPANSIRFLDDYQVPEEIRRHRAIARHYVLVYGRRSEFRTGGFSARRARAQQPDELFMTWDRVAPSSHYSDLLTVRLTSRGYQAVRVPPTVTLGPWHAEYHALLLDRDSAVDESKHLSSARAGFLKERWPYWDAWARRRRDFASEAIRLSDQE
jgi:hypothetical protein